MVERKTLNLVVVGSSPTEGVFCKHCAALAQLGERQTEDLKVPGSIPGGGTLQNTSPMAQSVARQAVNLQVAGSNPAGGDFAPMPQKRSPGIEPGFPRPQRGVLTTKL